MRNNLYSANYFQKFKRVGRLKQYFFSKFIDSKEPLSSRLVSGFRNGGCLLDYGCGSGLFLQHVSEHFKSVGIDVSTDAIKMAKKNAPKANYRAGSLSTLKKIDGLSYDIVTCFDVLEHVDVLGDYLKEFYRILKNDGWMVVGIPITGSIAFRNRGINWSGFEDKTHLRLWNRDHWAKVLEKYGFLVWQRYSYGIVNSPTSEYQLYGWLKLLHYVTQPLAIFGVSLPVALTDGDYLICIKNPYING